MAWAPPKASAIDESTDVAQLVSVGDQGVMQGDSVLLAWVSFDLELPNSLLMD